jgi:electron transport complex protein RnfB
MRMADRRGRERHQPLPAGRRGNDRQSWQLARHRAVALDLDCGVEGPPKVAVIDESRCIGCARCLPPCPVDAIVGAQRQLHSVLDDLCTGCGLCIAPCPVDCISLVDRASLTAKSPAPSAAINLLRYAAHERRARATRPATTELLAERKQRASRGKAR